MEPEAGSVLELLRCICYKKPVLAAIKLDERGKPFVHLRVFKQNRVFGEIVFTFGEMRLKCRECYRWHLIKIVNERAIMERITSADVVDLVEEKVK